MIQTRMRMLPSRQERQLRNAGPVAAVLPAGGLARVTSPALLGTFVARRCGVLAGTKMVPPPVSRRSIISHPVTERILQACRQQKHAHCAQPRVGMLIAFASDADICLHVESTGFGLDFGEHLPKRRFGTETAVILSFPVTGGPGSEGGD